MGGLSPSPAAPSPAALASSAPLVFVSPPVASVPTTVVAAHVLVAYKGAEGAPREVSRSKDEARARAREALAKLEKNTPFDEVVQAYSDDPVTRPTAGVIGRFEPYAMPAPFSDAAFALEVGALSQVVETARGFHVIQRRR